MNYLKIDAQKEEDPRTINEGQDTCAFILTPVSEIRSRLEIHGENTITFEFNITKPNWWFRMWQYLFLGWKWKDNK